MRVDDCPFRNTRIGKDIERVIAVPRLPPHEVPKIEPVKEPMPVKEPTKVGQACSR